MSELNMALLREALRERDEARAALTAETANANAYAHQRDEARAEVERLKVFARDCRDNWDCDADAHKHGTRCRACEAQCLFAEPMP